MLSFALTAEINCLATDVFILGFLGLTSKDKFEGKSLKLTKAI